jgi:hypothetical protein
MGRIGRTAPQAEFTPPENGGQKPNIVFILVDNLGYGELGVFGGGILRGDATPRELGSYAGASKSSLRALADSAQIAWAMRKNSPMFMGVI